MPPVCMNTTRCHDRVDPSFSRGSDERDHRLAGVHGIEEYPFQPGREQQRLAARIGRVAVLVSEVVVVDLHRPRRWRQLGGVRDVGGHRGTASSRSGRVPTSTPSTLL